MLRMYVSWCHFSASSHSSDTSSGTQRRMAVQTLSKYRNSLGNRLNGLRRNAKPSVRIPSAPDEIGTQHFPDKNATATLCGFNRVVRQ
jgi:hypothetical protein